MRTNDQGVAVPCLNQLGYGSIEHTNYSKINIFIQYILWKKIKKLQNRYIYEIMYKYFVREMW